MPAEPEVKVPEKKRRKTKKLRKVSGRGHIKGTWTQADLPKIIKKLNKLFGDLEWLSIEESNCLFKI